MRFLRKLGYLMQRERLRRELAEEMALHRDLKYRECEGDPWQTRREMGNMTLAAEESAEVRSFTGMEALAQDVRFAFRLLLRNPGLSLVVILSLALGIAGNTAAFSAVHALLIKPLPFADPDRLVRITEFYPKALRAYFQDQCRTMDVASVSPGTEVNLTGAGPALRVTSSAVSANLFSVLGVTPHLGRTFIGGEDRPGPDDVALMSYELWASRFRSDPGVVGRAVRIDGRDRTIVGVMKPGFNFPSARVQLWTPAALDPTNMEDYWGKEFVPLIGRLRGTATIEQARREVAALAANIWTMFPFPMPRHFNAGATVIPLQTDLAGETRTRVLLLLAAVGAVLLVACANVAGLLTARALARRKEMALRAALGAGRGRQVRQLLTESIVLAAAAGVVGLALGYLALQLFRGVVPPELPAAGRIAMNGPVALFTAVLCLGAGVAFGLAPALTATRLNLVEAVKTGGVRSASGRMLQFRNWLVGAEIALTLVLLTGASLLLRSLWGLSSAELGFQAGHVLAMKVNPDPSFCARPEACVAFYGRLLEAVRQLPGVTDATIANAVPLDGTLPSIPVDVEDHPRTADHPSPVFWTGAVGEDYLRLMGIRLVAGRGFTRSDTRGSAPVVLLAASTAERYWPGQNPLGKHVRVVWEPQWRTVVGVVADIRQHNLHDRTPASISGAWYMPYAQAVDAEHRLPASMNLMVRTTGSDSRVTVALPRLVESLNANVPAGRIVTLEQLAGESVSNFRSTAWLFLSFAAVALLLAAMGIYGLVAYAVAQRAHELSIRMALGSTGGEIVRLVLKRSLRLAVAAVGAGLVCAFALSRGLSALLYGVRPTDPLTYAGVAAALLAVTMAASLAPAWRASRADPIRTLRAE